MSMAHTEEENAKIRMTTDAILQMTMDALPDDVCCGCVIRNILGSMAATLGNRPNANPYELQGLLQIVGNAYQAGVAASRDPDNLPDSVHFISPNDPKPRPI